MPCKPGVAGLNPGFSIKPFSVSLKLTHTSETNPKELVNTQESHNKFFSVGDRPMSCKPWSQI